MIPLNRDLIDPERSKTSALTQCVMRIYVVDGALELVSRSKRLSVKVCESATRFMRQVLSAFKMMRSAYWSSVSVDSQTRLRREAFQCILAGA